MFRIKEDPHITKSGKIIRAYSLDELPQLFNLLLSNMSLIESRPLPIRDAIEMDAVSNIRHQLLPGISGLAQVSGRSRCSSQQFFYWDKQYIEQWSLWLDFKIFLKTIPAIARKSAY